MGRKAVNMNFSDILNDYAPYKGIVENLNNTPVSVAGIVESAQGQLIYSLKNENKSSALVVCYSDMEARKLYSDMEFIRIMFCIFRQRNIFSIISKPPVIRMSTQEFPLYRNL